MWAFVEGWISRRCTARLARSKAERVDAAIDPKILLALWLYATVDGVGSAREIERMTEAHDAYRWICGGVNVNHHTLSDFRCARVELLDHWLTHSVAVLTAQDLVKLEASGAGRDAGASERWGGLVWRRSTLEGCLEQARHKSKRSRLRSRPP